MNLESRIFELENRLSTLEGIAVKDLPLYAGLTTDDEFISENYTNPSAPVTSRTPITSIFPLITPFNGNFSVLGNISATNLSGTNTGDQTITLTGDVTGSGTGSFATIIANNAITTSKIADNQVTYSKIQTISANRLMGNSTGSTANVAEIPLNSTLEFSTGNLQRAALTGDVTATAGSNSTTIATGAVTTTKIADSNVTYVKIQNISSAKLLGNPTAISASPSEISLDSSLAFSTPGSALQRAALTGDVTASAGSNSTTIANSAVTYAKIQNVTANKILGNPNAAGGAAAAPSEIGMSTSIEISAGNIQRAALTGDVTASANSNATTIASNAVTTTKIADANVTYAKIQNMTGSRILGNAQATSGVPGELSLNTTLVFNSGANSIGRASLNGDVTASSGSNTVTIANNAVSYAKFQTASTGNVFLGRAASTTGNYSEVAIGASQLAGRGSTGDLSAITLGANLTMTGTTLSAATTTGGSVANLNNSAVSTVSNTLTTLRTIPITDTNMTVVSAGGKWQEPSAGGTATITVNVNGNAVATASVNGGSGATQSWDTQIKIVKVSNTVAYVYTDISMIGATTTSPRQSFNENIAVNFSGGFNVTVDGTAAVSGGTGSITCYNSYTIAYT